MIMQWKLVVIALIIWEVKSNCPKVCVCNLQHIDCSSTHLANISNDLFNKIPPISAIYHSATLPDKKTSTFSISFANNQLEMLPQLLFDHLPDLVSLDLSNNKISALLNIQSVLLGEHLLYLKLSSNPIRNLGFDTETVLFSKSISHLDVSNCDLHSITNAESLTYLTNLTELDLSGNPLRVIDHLVSHSLIYLDISRCYLGLNYKSIRDEAFKYLPNLKYLNLSMNVHLTQLPGTRNLSSSLVSLDASYCALEQIDLRSFPNLLNVSLKGNVVKRLQNGMFSENIYLQDLDLSENSIHHIEEYAFSGCKFLSKLDLSMNLLHDFDWKPYKQTPQLSFLNISRNLLTILNEITVPSLIALDVSRCDISQLSSQLLDRTIELKYLNLSHNSLETLPRLAAKKLFNLDISFCRLSLLQDDTFKGLPFLKSLNLMGNRLTNPLKESFLSQANINDLNLLDNPWHCDCNDSDFKRLRNFLIFHPSKYRYHKNLICHSPKEHSGTTWEKSCFEQIRKEQVVPKNETWFSFLVPFLTVCCLLAVFIVIRQAYISHGLEVQQREQETRRTNTISQRRQCSSRVDPHFFDAEFERGIHQSLNESTQRSPIQELSKLPSYEEALLLPKLQSSENLKNIVQKYEDISRFATTSSDNAHHHQEMSEEATNYPSTSSNSTDM